MGKVLKLEKRPPEDDDSYFVLICPYCESDAMNIVVDGDGDSFNTWIRVECADCEAVLLENPSEINPTTS